jgi:hypothetical protein
MRARACSTSFPYSTRRADAHRRGNQAFVDVLDEGLGDGWAGCVGRQIRFAPPNHLVDAPARVASIRQRR